MYQQKYFLDQNKNKMPNQDLPVSRVLNWRKAFGPEFGATETSYWAAGTRGPRAAEVFVVVRVPELWQCFEHDGCSLHCNYKKLEIATLEPLYKIF